MRRLLIGMACLVLLAGQVFAGGYQLKPEKIAENTYLVTGKLEDFSNRNGGNIVNTAFVVTEQGVVLFDTGPSRQYGEALRAAIAEVTNQPIVHVFNSHHHPDHFLGNQAFADATIWALPETGKQIAQHGDAFAENMYRLIGHWMKGTEVQLPSKPLKQEEMDLGGHRFKFMTFTGHSGADLVMLDQTTGVLFAGDLVFYQRALTTPHTPGVANWVSDLRSLAKLDYKLLVPGHGPVNSGKESIQQTIAYLSWLDQTLKTAAEQGLEMTEVIGLTPDPAFNQLKVRRSEFTRTVAHLYPEYEERAFTQ